jgi:hypothetical protein
MSTTASLSRGTEASDVHRCAVRRKQMQCADVRKLAEGDIVKGTLVSIAVCELT